METTDHDRFPMSNYTACMAGGLVLCACFSMVGCTALYAPPGQNASRSGWKTETVYTTVNAQRPVAPKPAPGTIVPVRKAMSSSFIHDYEGSDIVVEVIFYKMGIDNFVLGSDYDSTANTTFQVLAPGEAPQSGFGGMAFGIFAGTPKAQSDILFELKQGDRLLLRGAPIGIGVEPISGDPVISIFHATSVTRK